LSTPRPPQPSAQPPRPTAADWLRALRPGPVTADWREQLRAAVGAAIGLFVTGWLSHAWGSAYAAASPWLVAPLGASAVLVFAVPASPLAQPWSVVGGNTLSALVGVLCVRWLGSNELAAGLAVGAAIGLMFALRCLHPPGGASALLVALGGVTDPRFALYPVLVNSILLVLAAMAYNNATRRSYPHLQLPPAMPRARDEEARAIDADLEAVLARHNLVLDITRDDLKALLEATRLSGFRRKLARLRCEDIMSRGPITASLETPLGEAWRLFREHRIKALPVVDPAGHVIGIVTPADILRAAEPGAAGSASLDARQRVLRTLEGGGGGARPARVGEVMTQPVRVASAERHLAELIPLFAGTGHHHIPIIDASDRLVGMVTQSDVVAALSRPGLAAG
jgi:CBS domain-containing membrane protein